MGRGAWHGKMRRAAGVGVVISRSTTIHTSCCCLRLYPCQIVAVTQHGSLTALSLSCVDGSISATRISHVDGVGLSRARAIDTCELAVSRLRALVLAGPKEGTKDDARGQVGVVVALWSKSEKQWTRRTRVIDSSSSSSATGNGEQVEIHLSALGFFGHGRFGDECVCVCVFFFGGGGGGGKEGK